jgi:hypothetical protein
VVKRQKSMAEFIVVIILSLVLMASFISQFMSQKEQISQTGFHQIADNFVSQVNLVRSQWFMDNKPKKMLLRIVGQPKKISVSVNQWGWIDVDDNRFVCEKIWQLVVNQPLDFIKSPVSAIELNIGDEQQGHVCRYAINTGQYFEYRSATGQVIRSAIAKR